MNTTRNVMYGSGLQKPSRCEVATATFIAEPVSLGSSMPASQSSGMREKLDDLKSRGLSSLRDLQQTMNEKTSVVKSTIGDRTTTLKRTMNERTAVMKTNLQQSLASAKMSTANGVNSSMMKMQTSMATEPMKWAGIAAGSGFAIGMLGRFIHWRNKHRHHHYRPQLVVIESAC